MHPAKFHLKLLALPFAASEVRSSPVWSDDGTDKAKLSRSADLSISNGENLQMIISPPICETGGFSPLMAIKGCGAIFHWPSAVIMGNQCQMWAGSEFEYTLHLFSGSGRLELRPPTQSLCSSDSTSLQTSPASGFQNLWDSQIPILAQSPSSR